MGGSLSIHSTKINMYGHDGFMGSNACIGTGACFSRRGERGGPWWPQGA